MKIKFIRNVLFKGQAMIEGNVIEVTEKDVDAKYLIAIGKAVIVKTIETTSVVPEEYAVMAPPEKEVTVPTETAAMSALKSTKRK